MFLEPYIGAMLFTPPPNEYYKLQRHRADTPSRWHVYGPFFHIVMSTLPNANYLIFKFRGETTHTEYVFIGVPPARLFRIRDPKLVKDQHTTGFRMCRTLS